MRKLLIAAMLCMWIPIGSPAFAQYVPHLLTWVVYVDEQPVARVVYAGDAFPTKQGCEDYGTEHLPNVSAMLEAQFDLKEGDFILKTDCRPATSPGAPA